MDIVFIKQLEVRTVIGVFDWEREIKQKLVFDLQLGTDIKKAAASDALNDTLDYKAISHAIHDFVEASEYQLVETVAEKVAEMVLRDFPVKWLSIELNKPGAVSIAQSVGVKIERGQRG
ncbi:dihydroneopterin aldolase [Aliikangiella marina]|uniref:7,8-dihydroneopterin aldolase n=1 Tax=Aliikangiella marina TaxID=1712262 RepID=A0A545TCB9_9GAMM|nr:dihydroneopterin aldolase [Aliikangiella marina]TQV74867.1 dihydroneopterin aldolase [Aliikangiella marina]